MGERHAERLLVEGESSLEIICGDSDVVDPVEHGWWSLRSRQWVARRALSLGLLLHPEDLAERGDADLELLRCRLLRGDQPLDLVTRAVEGPRGGRIRVALAPGEHLR